MGIMNCCCCLTCSKSNVPIKCEFYRKYCITHTCEDCDIYQEFGKYYDLMCNKRKSYQNDL